MDVKIPSVGESVKEAVLVEWYKASGDQVRKDEPLFLIETDKITLEVAAAAAGRLNISVSSGQTVAIGAVVGVIETDGEPAAEKAPASAAGKAEPPAAPGGPPGKRRTVSIPKRS